MDEMLSQGKCFPSDSWGNGSATRTAALALFDRAAIQDVIDYSKVTHSHPDAIKASKSVFLAVRKALSGSKDLSKCWQILGVRKDPSQYSCGLHAMESIPPALIVFEKSSSFEETLKSAIGLGGDTDSIGALAGALAGAYYGVPQGFSGYLTRENRIIKLIKKYIPKT